MKIRTLIVVILGILAVSSVSLAQEVGPLEQELQEPVSVESSPPESQRKSSFAIVAKPPSTQPAQRSPRRYAAKATPPSTLQTPTEVVIFKLKHAEAAELANLIGNIFRVNVHVDGRTNCLVVSATKEQINSIANLIAQMDVGLSEASTPRDVQNLVYRVYMFELASGDEGMKPFSLILQVPPEASTMRLLDAARPSELQISGFCLSDERDRDGKAEILIQGKASSHVSLEERIVYDAFPDSRIKELKWDDAETFTNEIEAAQFWKLPVQLQKHIQKLLGDDIRTVGYWFGNSSVPGEVQAAIGPWTLNLQLDTESDHMLELVVEVELPREIHNFDTRLGRQQNDKILSNTIRAKIGKPIIIGYNRESYGTRKMGAMLILPEADTIQ
jgi:hypothetical protein